MILVLLENGVMMASLNQFSELGNQEKISIEKQSIITQNYLHYEKLNKQKVHYLYKIIHVTKQIIRLLKLINLFLT